MKGFPRRGSNRRSGVWVGSCLSGLNEGLPQKGKQFVISSPRTGPPGASMKGFPRRGSNPGLGRRHGDVG